jgi:hypothetical protein
VPSRIGVFDSRCVAVAYYNSPDFQKDTRQMAADLSAAKTAGNAARVTELEFQGPALQNLAHYQVFSNASIPNIVEKLGAVLPGVAADARVPVIVSKWDVAFKDAAVEYVDVTDAIVQAFKPDARVLQMVAAVKPQSPMPLLQAVKTLRPDR